MYVVVVVVVVVVGFYLSSMPTAPTTTTTTTTALVATMKATKTRLIFSLLRFWQPEKLATVSRGSQRARAAPRVL